MLRSVKLAEVSHEMLVLMLQHVSSRVAGFLVPSQCQWGKLQDLSLLKAVMSFRVAGVAIRDIPTCFMTCQTWSCVAGATFLRRFQKMHCIFRADALWRSPMSICWPARHFRRVVLRFFASRNVTAAPSGDTHHSTLYILHPLQSTLYNLNSTLHTLHFTLHTFNFTLSIPHFHLYTPHFTLTLYTSHFPLHTLHLTLDTSHFTLYTFHFPLHTSHFPLYTHTLYTPHLSLYTPHSSLSHLALCALHFRLHTLHSTLHILHSTLYTHTLHSTLLYILHFTHHTLHSTLDTLHYTLRSTLQTLHFTLYTPHCIFLTPRSTLYIP